MAEGVPAATLAALLAMDEREIKLKAAEGIMVKSGPNNYLLAPSVRNYVLHLREVAAGRQGSELNAVDENARLKIVMRQNYELKNAALKGSMLSTDEIVDLWSALTRTIKGMVLSIPSRIQEKLPHFTVRGRRGNSQGGPQGAAGDVAGNAGETTAAEPDAGWLRSKSSVS